MHKIIFLNILNITQLKYFFRLNNFFPNLTLQIYVTLK